MSTTPPAAAQPAMMAILLSSSPGDDGGGALGYKKIVFVSPTSPEEESANWPLTLRLPDEAAATALEAASALVAWPVTPTLVEPGSQLQSFKSTITSSAETPLSSPPIATNMHVLSLVASVLQ